MKIAALIITYNPDPKKIIDVIDSLLPQVELILFVDNNSNNKLILNKCESTMAKTKVIYLEDNLGIAKATNIGFDYLIKNSFKYCLLSDQDTVYNKNYVSKMCSESIENNDERIIVLAPSIYDNTTKQKKHVYALKNEKIIKVFPIDKMEIFQTIASGLFIDLEKINNDLYMNEELFIDYVDFEWCWRLKYHGYKILYLPKVIINHSLGDSVRNIGDHKIAVRNPIRYYYIIRNTLFLSRQTLFLTKRQRNQLFFKSIQYLLGYLFISPKKIILFRALFDGLIGRMGKIKNEYGSI